jgi:alkylation response protein AidB-like acyl-CoA dehydrogenase
MPKMLTVLADEMLFATNPSFMLYPLLSVGAGMALNSYASQEQKETYLPKIYSGEWSGTMCLTEPHAGTDLGLLKPKLNRMKMVPITQVLKSSSQVVITTLLKTSFTSLG